MSESFKIGDRVTWASAASGKAKKKTGTVVVIVPPSLVPIDLFRRQDEARAIRESHRDSGFACLPRGHESYLVSVPGRGKPVLYWPRVKGLRRVD